MSNISTSPASLSLPNNESLRIGFELTSDLVQAQLEQNDALDMKANFVLGSATVIIGTFAAFFATHTAASMYSMADRILLNTPLVLSYLVTIAFASLGYRVRHFRAAPHPRKFVTLFLPLDEHQVRLKLLDALVIAYEINERQLTKKALYVSTALAFFCLEVVILVATLMFVAIN